MRNLNIDKNVSMDIIKGLRSVGDIRTKKENEV